MKGLLLKDLYMMRKYCRLYLWITVAFVALSLVNSENLFFVFYPCMLSGMIPVNLLAYDERSHWLQYSETMPYTRAHIVSGKYLIGLLTQMTVWLVTGVAQAIRMWVVGDFSLIEYGTVMAMMVVLSLTASSLTLPFIFKLGVEKGRMAYYIMIGAVCAGSVLFANSLTDGSPFGERTAYGVGGLLCLVGIGLYVLSWYLSVVFFQKREL